jgi:DNA-directed RNA polymerase subunit beta'
METSSTFEGLSIFSDTKEVDLAYETKKIGLRELIAVRMDGKLIKTTHGRIWFNKILPKEFDFVNEPMAGSKAVNDLVVKSLEIAGRVRTAKLIDDLKDIGFKGFTLSGISLSMADCGYLAGKDKIIEGANKLVVEI